MADEKRRWTQAELCAEAQARFGGSHPVTDPRRWEFDMPITKALSLNGAHRNPYAAARERKKIRRATAVLAGHRLHIPPLQRARIELHYAPRDTRRRDPINLAPTLKPVEDGLVDAGVIPDDTPQFIDPCMPIIEAATGKPGRFFVVVHELLVPQSAEPGVPGPAVPLDG